MQMDESTRPYRIVDIQLLSDQFRVALGSSLELPFAIHNRAGTEDYFEISVQGIPLGWVLMDMPVMFLAAGERRESSLVIQAPITSPVSIGDYPVTLQAVSQTDPLLRAEARFRLQVDPGIYGQTQAMPTMPMESPGRLGLLLTNTQITGAPGDTITVPVVVANRTLEEGAFYITVEGLPPEWVSAATPVIRLLAGEHREVLVYIQPPSGPGGRAGRHPFTIRVVSQTDPRLYASADALLTLAANSRFSSDLLSARMDAGNTARLRIQNLGNFPDTFTVQFQNLDGDLDFAPPAVGPIHLMPGEQTAVEFAVSPRRPNLLGSQKTFSYAAVVRTANGESQSQNGQVISRSLIPLWVVPLVAVLCLSALCGMGYLWNWNQNRLAGIQETIDAQERLSAILTATASAGIVLEGTAGAETATSVALTALPTETSTPEPTETPEPPTETPTLAPTNTDTPVPPTFTPTLPEATLPPESTPTLEPTLFALPAPGRQVLWFSSDREGGLRLFQFDSEDAATTLAVDTGGSDTQPAFSPDGSRVLFASNAAGNYDIYVMNADGTALVNLTDAPSDEIYPAWSPDGSQIAFVTDRDGNNEIYVMDADGSNLVNLTQNPGNDMKPAWYHQRALIGDAQQILFATNRDGNYEIYSMNPDGSEPVNLTRSPANDILPAVPFVGGRAAFVSDRDGNLELYRIDLDGGNPVNLTNNPAEDTKPVWSPDGNWIAFTTNRDGNREIYVMAADGSSPVNVTRSPSDDLDPAWR
jgi:TolB protein